MRTTNHLIGWALIVIGISIMVVSLASLTGAYYRNTFLIWGLPICYVLHHCCTFRVHHLCLCCHQ
ncbi:hypothetical protein NC652_031396 [Populus alba x Populus x berolinensis]|nr:hypothetical protein NC652_031396 [Populus alba x Populus x berolinensis]